MTITDGWTRRHFLRVSFTAGGALVVAACSGGDGDGATSGSAVTTGGPETSTDGVGGVGGIGGSTPGTDVSGSEAPFVPNLFVSIDVDGTVTLTVHRSEVGQGVRTALAMILADELDADWTKIKIEQAPANSKLGSQTTGGSGSITDNYTPLRRAAAAARSMLVTAAATHWGIDPQKCGASLGTVINTVTNDRLGFGDLVVEARDVAPPQPIVLKDAADFRLIGTAVPRVDGASIVTGTAAYGLDQRIDGLLHAVVARCPVPGGTVATFDPTAAEAVDGVQSVVQVPSGIAVVADNTWSAIKGRERLDVKWIEGDNAKWSTATIDAALKDIIDTRVAAAGTAAAGLSIEARYDTPFAAHAAMEPVNCIADVRDDSCVIIAPTQNPQEVQSFVSDQIGLPTEVQVTLIGGGFGRRLEVDFAIEAAEVSRAAGAPVQVVWTREDDFAFDYCRQPTKHWLRAEWDEGGTITTWRHYLAAPGLNGIAYRAGTDVLKEGLAVPYSIGQQTSQPSVAPITLPTGPWRGVMAGPNAFANECFLDEVAAALGRDPYELRQSLLPEGDPMRAVLDLAATSAGWGADVPAGHGQGIACHEYHDVPVAMVADVAVSRGAVRVERIVCAIDCGLVIQPDMVAQQIEGAVAFALTSMLKSEITYSKGRVQQHNFSDHPLLGMNEMPVVEVHIAPSQRDPQGVGEMGVPPTVPAVANAIFAATGARIRRIPIRPSDLA